MFLIIVGLILIIVIVILSLPFLRKPTTITLMGPEAEEDQERLDLEIERNTILHSLAELELDLAQEKYLQLDYDRLKAVDERRLVTVLGRIDELQKKERAAAPRAQKASQRKASGTVGWATSVVLSVVVIGSATWIYDYIMDQQALKIQRQRAGQSAQGMPDPAEMVAMLEARLRENPNNLEDQLMAGRSYMALERYDDAIKAWTKVLELNPRNDQAHFNLGVIILETRPRSDQRALQEAREHFEIAIVKLPREAALLWYHGVVLVHQKKYSLADESWTTAFQSLMPGTDESEFVKDALQKLRAGNPPLF